LSLVWRDSIDYHCALTNVSLSPRIAVYHGTALAEYSTLDELPFSILLHHSFWKYWIREEVSVSPYLSRCAFYETRTDKSSLSARSLARRDLTVVSHEHIQGVLDTGP